MLAQAILVIEDDAGVQHLMSITLRRADDAGVLAENGPLLRLLDWLMSVFDDWEFLKGDCARAHPPPTNHRLFRCASYGVWLPYTPTVLAKPFGAAELLALVHQHLAP